MHLSSIICTTLFFTGVEGKLSRITKSRSLKPEAVGAYHTDAFEILGEKYRSKKPETQSDVVKDIASILAEYCPLEDAECVSNAYQTADEEFDRASRGIIHEIKYPDSFDPKMKELVESIRTSTEEINELNLDEVLYSLEGIREKLEDMTDTNEDHVRASLVGLSVAIESTKLWHSTYYDSEHPLHFMIGYFSGEGGRRRLQESPFFFDPIIIFADYSAAMSTGFGEIQESMQNPASLLPLLNTSIMASASALLQTGTMVPVIPNGDDDDTAFDFVGGVTGVLEGTGGFGGTGGTGVGIDDAVGDDEWFFCEFPQVPPIISLFACGDDEI